MKVGMQRRSSLEVAHQATVDLRDGQGIEHELHLARQQVKSSRKRRAATASGGSVRVLDHELRTLQVFFVIDLGAN